VRNNLDVSPEHRPRAPLFSVIIPSYNHAQFLPDSIASVLQQTLQNFEIVVIDDGSTDNTAAIVARYPQVRYVHQTNQGLAAARNAGIRESTGRFLVFLDADDTLRPRALEASLDCFQAHPECGFVSGNFRRVGPDGISPARQPRVDSKHYLALLKGNYIGMHATVAYRREVIESVGGFDVRLPACEDYDLYLRIARHFPVARHDEVVADYRIHEANMSGDAAMMLECTLRVLRAQRSHMAKDAEALAAYKQGTRFWQRYYGRRIIEQLKTGTVPPRQWNHAMVTLIKLAPRTLVADGVRRIARRLLPERLRRGARFLSPHAPAVGKVSFGDLRRLSPISRSFGFDRGQPIDRFYIENFLRRNSADIRGRVLEVGDNTYTQRFGGDRVTHSDVFHAREGNPCATFVGDLARADGIPSATFHCIILTQTLHLIYDLRAAVATLKRILTPDGVLLATVPGTISQLEKGQWASVWHWGFTDLSVRKIFADVFLPELVSVEAHGNVLTSIAFLQGMAAGELTPEELAYHDPLYPLLITIRAISSFTGCNKSN
jgi:SAM-dependent methyltransferase